MKNNMHASIAWVLSVTDMSALSLKASRASETLRAGQVLLCSKME